MTVTQASHMLEINIKSLAELCYKFQIILFAALRNVSLLFNFGIGNLSIDNHHIKLVIKRGQDMHRKEEG
jgi:hypothetical protein